MGLLDDAIREHLELKRLRGADPQQVAHEEHEALGPVLRKTGTSEDGGGDGQRDAPPRGEPADPDGSLFSGSNPSREADLSDVGQETVEINMDAELDRGHDGRHGRGQADEHTASVVHPARAHSSAEESLEWEVPGDRSSETEDVAQPSGEGGSLTGDGSEAAEHVEDVLEETPDFLRETPEQERLWFEQRPPRDFDFNE